MIGYLYISTYVAFENSFGEVYVIDLKTNLRCVCPDLSRVKRLPSEQCLTSPLFWLTGAGHTYCHEDVSDKFCRIITRFKFSFIRQCFCVTLQFY